MAEQGQPKVSNTQMNKKDPMRGLSITIQGYAGIINTQPPDVIPDNATQSIVNYLPIGNGIVRKLQSPALYASLPNTPIRMINDVINNNLAMYVILSDGSAGTVSNGVYTQTQAPGTFSTESNQIAISNWQNQFFLISDANKGLFAFQPNYSPTLATWAANTAYAAGQIVQSGSYYYYCITAGTSGASAPSWSTTIGDTTTDGTVKWVTFTLSNGLISVQPTIQGTCMIVYQGRVFIGNNRTISYSAPLSFFDWTIADGSGTLQIASPDLKQQIIQLIAYMNNIYVIGDHAVIAITGTSITNDPSQWFVMEIFNTTGSIYPNSMIDFNNVIYLVNEYGVWQIASSQSQKVDYPIDTTQFSWTTSQADIALINNLNFYLIPVNGVSPAYLNGYNYLLAYCIDLQQYFFLDFGFNVKGVYTTRSISDHTVYIMSDNAIYKYGTGSSNIISKITSKVFDFGNLFFYKLFRRMGFNINMINNNPNIQVSLNIINMNGRVSSVPVSPIQSIQFTNHLLFASNPNLNAAVSLSNTENNFIIDFYLYNNTPQVYEPIFYIQQGGISISYTITDNSNAVYDIIQTYILANLGKSII